MEVRIKKASSIHLWYSAFIDKSFIVYMYQDSMYYWVNRFMYILPEDVEEVYYKSEDSHALIVSFTKGLA